jgi:predicted ATPase
VARACEAQPNAAVLVARGDPVGAQSSYLLARQLVRAGAGLPDALPEGGEEALLRAHVAGRCKGSEAARIADYLSVLAGYSPGPRVRAAQDDPRAMAEGLRRSFTEWLDAESAARPVLVVLEDVHWGDLPSLTYLADTLRSNARRPLMVLALALPEVHEAFPRLLSMLDAHEMPLARLTPRAAERLARAVLGDAPSVETVQRIVERADGNAFFLEELIRRVAEGGDDALPESIAAVVQARLDRLDEDTRRIVRAASVLGEVFWTGALEHLLGAPNDLEANLRYLAEHDVVVPSTRSRFPGQKQYAFRHGLLREVAYAMLTDADATQAHRLAGEWLEAVGEEDALALARHFERGDAAARAVPWLVHAARRSAEGGNLDVALELADRGLACGAEGVHRGFLRLVQGTALSMRNDWRRAIGLAEEAMALVPEGSTPWFVAVSRVLSGALFLGDLGAGMEIGRASCSERE